MKIRAAVRVWQEWSQWFTREYNWRTFSLVNFAFETSTYMGKEAELSIGLIGLHLQVTVYDQVSRDIALKPIHETIKRIEDGTEKTYEVCTKCWQTISPEKHWLKEGHEV